MVQKRRVEPAPSMAAASRSELRDRLQAGDEEEEVVADLLPGGGGDDQRHRLGAVEQRVPVDAELAERPGEGAEAGVEEEEPEHAGDGGGDGVGPDEQRAVEALAADDLLGLDGEEEGDRHGEEHGPEGEDDGDLDRVEVGGVGEDAGEVLEADEAGGEAEGVLAQDRLVEGLDGGPVEEDEADRELRRDEEVGEEAVREGRAHRSDPAGEAAGTRNRSWRSEAEARSRRFERRSPAFAGSGPGGRRPAPLRLDAPAA